MAIRKIIRENWLTQKNRPGYLGGLGESESLKFTIVLTALLLLGSILYINDVAHLHGLMSASFQSVVLQHNYYRLWTALFAHADLEHIMSNLFLFIPFSYLLTRHFSFLLFPVVGFLVGGLINLIVINYLGGAITLIGVSGVVYWMGATWMSLSFFIDRREKKLSRFIKLSGVSLILFFSYNNCSRSELPKSFLRIFHGVLNRSLGLCSLQKGL